ncbi:MAG: patatin-like phospholipase family protein [Gammaproteobacteria bacterium]|nr:patatin-like phospholipase family protein [Gammaproteobacteria bacterium]
MPVHSHRATISCVLAAWLLAGCAHVQRLPKADPTVPSFPPLSRESDTLIGVALSGGGSRAAYFAAAGLEALASLRPAPGQRSLLEQVSYVSSVSGGSVASSYFATQKPPADIAVLNPDGSLSPAYRDFFRDYRTAMGRNIQGSMEWRQVWKGRWLNSTKRATSLADVLDANFLEQETFAQLYDRERKGDSPRLILNATLYNNGRRLAMTTVPRDDFHYDFLRKLQRELPTENSSPEPLPESLQLAREALNPLTFQDLGADPGDVPISRAVAASASFPFFIGPITAQVEGTDAYLHAGDGGLFDNQGTESLVQLFLKKLDDGKAKRALVIAFDSSFPFWVKNSRFDRIEKGFEIFVKDAGRIVSIMEQRANAYQSMVWHILQSQQIVLPDDATVRVIVLRHTDKDAWPEKPGAALPDACRNEVAELRTREEVRERLALIPTKFKLTSDCDKALLRETARRVVEQNKAEIVRFLAGR